MNNLLSKAISIASKAHEDQFRWCGEPYILHPIRIMMEMKTTEEKIVAILHDTIEDTVVNDATLKALGFDKLIIDAILAITKKENEPYEDYIFRVKDNKLARKVKLKDIKDNLDVTSMKSVTKEHQERINKYLWSIKILS
jgi:GTP diphosphokinase / guanosine-3',5'-bis(diphosphate) 3'-diphosphatase